MKSILDPDYWIEIPAGEFLTGLSEAQREFIRERLRDEISYSQLANTQRQLLDAILAKIQQRAERRANQSAETHPLGLTPEENALRMQEPFQSLVNAEHTLVALPPQRLVWLDRFYIARFPLTRGQFGAFREGTSAANLPGALEGPATESLIDGVVEPEIKQLLRSTVGQDVQYSSREMATLQYDQALRLCQELGARLPTMLEWEKAARGTDGRLYPWGNEWDLQAGYFYRGQEVSSINAYRVDAFPRGVSPYGVWSIVGGLPEYVLGFELRPSVINKGCHPKNTTATEAWFDHLVVQKGSDAYWITLRPALAQWPQQRWSGFKAQEAGQTDQLPLQLPELPSEFPSLNRPSLKISQIHRMLPLAELTTDDAHRVGSGEKIIDLAWSPDGQRIAVADWLSVWLYKSGVTEPQHLEDRNNVVAFSPDGTILASSDKTDASLRLFDAKVDTGVLILKTPDVLTTSLAFGSDGALLVSTNSRGGVRLWEINTGSELSILQGHTKAVERAVFSPDGVWLASASVDGTVRLWEVRSRTEKKVFVQQTLPVYDVAFTPDGNSLAAAGADGAVRLWDVRSGREQQIYHDPDSNPAASLSFNPDGTLLASGHSNGMFKIWETATGRALRTVRCDMGWVVRVAFNPLGTLLATSSRTVVLWGISQEEEAG